MKFEFKLCMPPLFLLNIQNLRTNIRNGIPATGAKKERRGGFTHQRHLRPFRFGLSSDVVCLHLDDVLYKSAREVSRFATVALVDVESEEIQVYLKYFDITFMPSIVFFFNAHHMKMDSGRYIEGQGKLIINCPLRPERIPKFQLLFKDV